MDTEMKNRMNHIFHEASLALDMLSEIDDSKLDYGDRQKLNAAMDCIVFIAGNLAYSDEPDKWTTNSGTAYRYLWKFMRENGWA